MRKIRLSDTDLELFDIEISPSDFNFYQKHKDAFRTMWKEQVRILTQSQLQQTTNFGTSFPIFNKNKV